MAVKPVSERITLPPTIDPSLAQALLQVLQEHGYGINQLIEAAAAVEGALLAANNLDDLANTDTAIANLISQAAATTLQDLLTASVETGTWTPVLTRIATDAAVTYAAQTGSYVRAGPLVLASCRIDASSISGGTGRNVISGIPFAVSASPIVPYTGVLASSSAFSTLTKIVQAFGSSSPAHFFFFASGTNTDSQLNEAYSASGEVSFSILYRADD